MSFLLKFAVAIALSFIATSSLSAQDRYAQVDIGGDYYAPNDLNGVGFDIGPGFNVGGRVGQNFGGFRGEVELNFALASIDVASDVGDDDATYFQTSAELGIYRDIGPAYVGAGGGLVYQEISTEILGVEVSESEINFLAHAEAGVAFDVTENITLVPHYRATWLPGFQLDDEVIVHSLRMGVRFGL